MTSHRFSLATPWRGTTLLAATLLCAPGLAQDGQDNPAAKELQARETLRGIEQTGTGRNEERREAQTAIDTVHGETRALVDTYRAELKVVEGLETYIEMLDVQLANQKQEIDTLQTSITDVAVIERQVLPLLARMIEGLEQFVALDVPFLREERRARVTKLRALLSRSDVTVAEKARRVFEAFQIENDYGRTIEAYRAKLELNGSSFDADFLRVGRLALMYRTVGDQRLGFWASDHWEPLPDSPYRRLLEQGLKVARQEVAPELLTIPLASARREEGP
jgi:uncharacterized coiled-coil protein SlyX